MGVMDCTLFYEIYRIIIKGSVHFVESFPLGFEEYFTPYNCKLIKVGRRNTSIAHSTDNNHIRSAYQPPTKSTPGIFNNCNCFFPFLILYSIVLKSDRLTDDASLRN